MTETLLFLGELRYIKNYRADARLLTSLALAPELLSVTSSSQVLIDRDKTTWPDARAIETKRDANEKS